METHTKQKYLSGSKTLSEKNNPTSKIKSSFSPVNLAKQKLFFVKKIFQQNSLYCQPRLNLTPSQSKNATQTLKISSLKRIMHKSVIGTYF